MLLQDLALEQKLETDDTINRGQQREGSGESVIDASDDAGQRGVGGEEAGSAVSSQMQARRCTYHKGASSAAGTRSTCGRVGTPYVRMIDQEA